jgi:hypothetical protein
VKIPGSCVLEVVNDVHTSPLEADVHFDGGRRLLRRRGRKRSVTRCSKNVDPAQQCVKILQEALELIFKNPVAAVNVFILLEVPIRDTLDVLVDGGRTKGVPASTVLDVTVDPPCLVRPGRIDRAAIEAALGGAPIAEKG